MKVFQFYAERTAELVVNIQADNLDEARKLFDEVITEDFEEITARYDYQDIIEIDPVTKTETIHEYI